MPAKNISAEGFGINEMGLVVPGGHQDENIKHELEGSLETHQAKLDAAKKDADTPQPFAVSDLWRPDNYGELTLPGAPQLNIEVETTNGVQKPKSGVHTTGNQLYTPKEKTLEIGNADNLVLAGSEEKPRRSQSEILLAHSDVFNFLKQDLEKSGKINDDTKWLLGFFEDIYNGNYQPRVYGIVEWDSHQEKFLEKKDAITPSPYEQLGISIAKMAQEDAFKFGAPRVLGKYIDSYIETTHNQRRRKLTDLVDEMPTLTEEFVQALETGDLDKSLRYKIYDVLYQVQIPDSQLQDVLRAMDKQQATDLEHPLALRLTLETEKRIPNAAWTLEQTRRRNELYKQLEVSPQEIVEHFEHINKLAKGVVIAAETTKLKRAKVGVEIELAEVGRDQKTDAKVQFLPHDPGGWDFYTDTIQLKNMEIARLESKILWGSKYLRDLNTLGIFLSKYMQAPSSLHIHFDSEENVGIDLTLNNLVTGKYFEAGFRDNYAHNTKEIRGLAVPGEGSRLRMAAIANSIIMYTEIGPTDIYEAPLIHLKGDESVNAQTLGHISRYITSPIGRLAALKCLQDETMLYAINPFAIASSMEPDSRIHTAKTFLSRKTGVYHTKLAQLLKVNLELDPNDTIRTPEQDKEYSEKLYEIFEGADYDMADNLIWIQMLYKSRHEPLSSDEPEDIHSDWMERLYYKRLRENIRNNSPMRGNERGDNPTTLTYQGGRLTYN